MRELKERFKVAIESDSYEGYENLSVMCDNVLPDDVVAVFFADGCEIYQIGSMYDDEIEALRKELQRYENVDDVVVVNSKILNI